MKLSLLFRDELGYFYKTRAMIYLWVGLPLIMGVAHLFPQEGPDGAFSISIAHLAAVTVGLIAGPMIVASIINEMKQNVYVLFVIRPFERRGLLLARFFAVFACLAVAALVSVLVGLIIDAFTMEGNLSGLLLQGLVSTTLYSLCALAFSCAFGVFLGVLCSSVYVGIILHIFLYMQLSNVMMFLYQWVPKKMEWTAWWHGDLFLLFLAGSLIYLCLWLAIRAFDKKEF